MFCNSYVRKYILILNSDFISNNRDSRAAEMDFQKEILHP